MDTCIRRVEQLKKNIMKKTSLYLTIFTFLLISLTACKDKFTKTFQANVPIYQNYEDWRAQTIKFMAPTGIKNPGKIWIKDQYLFINEPFVGVHVFDNSTPANPVNLGFLPVLSTLDIAVHNSILYVDSYTDILTFDISNPHNIEFLCRTTDVFNNNKAQSSLGYNHDLPATNINPDLGVIIGWEQQEVTEEIYYGGIFYDSFELIDVLTINNSGGVNLGGSMASFAIHGDQLYVIQNNQIITFNIQNECIERVNNTWTSNNLETLFVANDHLFVGTTTGMLIYALDDPSNPNLVSEYPHIGSCDPVIVNQNRAYVTLRDGNSCSGTVNQLVVVNIENLSNPYEIKTYEMTNPHGLGMDENTLFLCDGIDGLKVFDASDDLQIDQNLLSHFSNIQAYDVIPYKHTLILSAQEGIYQYDYSDLNNISLLSLIAKN